VSASFTLGNLTGTYRYHANDFDPHVAKGNGVVGYVWPGAGLNTYSGFPNYATINQPPGYQSPYPGGKPGGPGIHGPGGVSVPNPGSSWYQLEGDSYSPFGAVLTGSTGDLIFAINSTCVQYGPTGGVTASNVPPYSNTLQCIGNPNEGWDTLQIYIPPGFTVPPPPAVASTLTNDYSNMYVVTAGPWDRYAPGWTVIIIPSDIISNNGQNAQGWSSTGCSSGSCIGSGNNPPNYHYNAINFTAKREWYYIRVNGVTAPTVAGRYFFKIALVSQIQGQAFYPAGEEGVAGANGNGWVGPQTSGAGTNLQCSGAGCGTGNMNYHGMQPSQFIPTENWPVLLVKGEIDPAIITGTIRYAGYNQSLYSQPIREAGRVYASMTTRLDPYTDQARPDLPKVDAVGYFNATAQGHYEVEGVAPGVYDVYASAMGFPETLIASSITITRSQSLHFDGYLQPGPVIHGNVFTKHQFGDEPWPINSPRGCPNGVCYTEYINPNTYIKIELYDAPTVSHIPAATAKMVSWSPLPCVAAGQETYYNRRDAGYCNDPRYGANIAAPWHEYAPSNGYYSGTSASNFGFYQVSTGNNDGRQVNKRTQDPAGVGPPQHWYVQGGTTIPFHYEFGVKGEYGAPRDFDGMVPQVYATWVNGLTPGRYYVRAWIFRYVQSALDGSTFQEYYFDITPNEWAGDVTLTMDLRMSSWVNKTVHFHNVINGITDDPIDTGGSILAGALVDRNGVVWSYNQTLLGYKGLYTHGKLTGFDPQHSWYTGGTTYHFNCLDKAHLNQFAVETGKANIQFWGFNDTWGGENYGIPSGTYYPHVFALGYIEDSPVEYVSVTLSGNPTSVSDHMYRGVGFNVTVFSIDWQRPRVQRNWIWGNPTNFPYVSTYSSNAFQNAPLQNNAAGGCGGQLPGTQVGFPAPPGTTGGTCLVGQEIDIGFYLNGTLINGAGDGFWGWHTTPPGPSDVKTSCLYQNYTTSFTQLCGGGWDPQRLLASNQTYVNYQGNANDAFFGLDPATTGDVGGNVRGWIGVLTDTALNGNWIANYGPLTVPGTSDAVYNTLQGFTGMYPTAFPSGQYDLRAYTYGYIQNQPVQVQGMLGQVANSRINLVIGVNVTLDILFKKEHIITPTTANMSARVRLFNDQAALVAEWMSSEGVYAGARVSSVGTGPGGLKVVSGFATAANGETQFPFGQINTVPYPLPVNTLNYVPGGVTELKILLAGLPAIVGRGNGMFDYNAPTGTYYGDPASGFVSAGCDFDLGCFSTNPSGNPGRKWDNPAYYPNYGILGSSDYQGGWTAEVDFVNWYQNNTACPHSGFFLTTASDCGSVERGTVQNNTYTGSVPIYYAPVPGLLMGESYHIIPGTTAVSGVSLTEDWAEGPTGVNLCPTMSIGFCATASIGMSLAFNHLGPYSQQGVWQIANAHLSGEASGIFEVDLNGLVTGNALAFNYANEFRPVSWATITITGAGLPSSGLNFYTYDAHYEAYVPATPGTHGASGSNTYKMTVSMPGLAPQTFNIAVSSGMLGIGANIYLEESNIPVPEYMNLIITAFSALAASVYILGRRRK
jgi:hypothetical protein